MFNTPFLTGLSLKSLLWPAIPFRCLLISLKSSETGASYYFLSFSPDTDGQYELSCHIYNTLVFPNLSIPLANLNKLVIPLLCVRPNYTQSILTYSHREWQYIFPPTGITLHDWSLLVLNIHLMPDTYPLCILFCRTHNTSLTWNLRPPFLILPFRLIVPNLVVIISLFIAKANALSNVSWKSLATYSLIRGFFDASVKYSSNWACTTGSSLLVWSVYATFAKVENRSAKATIDSSCLFRSLPRLSLPCSYLHGYQNDGFFLTPRPSMLSEAGPFA